ncbi:MAG: shikimate dehydrogenase [Oscillospiraceae bacterium]|jgi:shikimate dehydrogenase|nr:shikimate dehydrogenase [Oscillospiraceae bacterium]
MIKLAVIGHPVGHSKSPAIHTRFAADTGLDVEYTAIDVTYETLPRFIERARREFAGFNVTMPLKQEIVRYLDETVADAVNTVVVKNGKLYGYSTDGTGVIAALRERYPDLSGKKIVILGFGGAAKSAVSALTDIGADVTVHKRNPGAAALDFGKLALLCESADVVINATSLGMSGCDSFAEFDWLDSLKAGAAVFDFVYNPLNTELLAEATIRGLTVIGGLSLLTAQAAESFRLFTGKQPPIVPELFEL